ncbi:MAG: biopolymer transporter ExbD [Bacteroidales bacterium]|jgi:biopolymer transport protein ExbD|nr:biopolymer transporter ExbD [Bacteroidales bacterium]
MPIRPTGQFSAASMADIAFLLLIFFLVATTMDIDSGIYRTLSPYDPDQPENTDEIKERNVYVVLINSNDQLLVEGIPLNIYKLREKTKEFIENPENKANLPEKAPREVEYFGEVMVSKGIVSLQNDRGTTYGTYIKVQNELIAAFSEVREKVAMQRFGKHYADLPKEKQDAIRAHYPRVISEAEPKNIGGK